MKCSYPKRKIVTLLCSTLIFVSLPFSVQADQVNVNNWAIEVEAKRVPESVPVYLRPKDSKESGGIIEIPKSPYISGLSSIVLVKRGEGQALGFVAGEVSSPGNHLLIVEVQIHNTAKEAKSLRIGDITLASANQQNLPYAAVAKDNSCLVGKTSIAAWKASQEVAMSTEPEEKLKLTYCFIVPAKCLPVKLEFQKAKITKVTEYDKLAEYKSTKESPFFMVMAGQMELSHDLEVKEIDGSFSPQDIDVQFKSKARFSKGDQLAARNMGGIGASSFNTTHIPEKLNGKESSETLSSLYMFSGGVYLAGTINMLNSISPSEVTVPFEIDTDQKDSQESGCIFPVTPSEKPKLHATFKSSFQAQKGDALAAVGQVGEHAFVLSVHTME